MSVAARAETTIAAAGLAAIGLHVLDDSFFQPEPGISAADHLASGLVPVAVLAGAGVAYPRLRPGFRAALAIVLGLFGIVVGSVEPVYYGPDEGLSGDDFTGLLAAAGGLALVALGTRTAWSSRKHDGTRPRRWGRRALLAVGWALAGVFVLLPLFLSYGFTHVARLETPSGNLGAPHEQASFHARDGLRLDGWFVPSRNGATVIVYPGTKGTQRHARMLVRHGYGVLVFDRRGEGTSEGDPNALGWGFDQDLLGALAYLRGRDDVDRRRIGGLGLSVGGEALLQTAAETSRLGAVVSDGAGSRSVREDTVRTSLRKVPEIVASGVMTAGTAVFSDRLPPPSLEQFAGRIEATPVFLIYATRGAGGEDNQPRYYEALPGPKQIWKIDTSHTHGLSARPREYERRVVGFFDRTLLGR
ncbi:MAG TPA: CocE/NonD family hydrolase [Gaiellaceae bacterium]|nr:CocE/NonD family hydrolase [Gaiellaceae bacterium]